MLSDRLLLRRWVSGVLLIAPGPASVTRCGAGDYPANLKWRSKPMGADMLLRALPAAKVDQPRTEQLEAAIDGLDDDELCVIADSMSWMDEDEDNGRPAFSGVRDRLKDHLTVVAECGNGVPYRGYSTLYLPGWPYEVMFTGGLSWGDAPTDLCDDFQAIACSTTLWQMLEDYARCDAVKAAATA